MRTVALIAVVLLAGCRTTEISIPYDAPVLASCDFTLANPYVRVKDQWVKATGTVTRHAGALVVLPSAAQPAK